LRERWVHGLAKCVKEDFTLPYNHEKHLEIAKEKVHFFLPLILADNMKFSTAAFEGRDTDLL
jgi:hypothetical protein